MTNTYEIGVAQTQFEWHSLVHPLRDTWLAVRILGCSRPGGLALLGALLSSIFDLLDLGGATNSKGRRHNSLFYYLGTLDGISKDVSATMPLNRRSTYIQCTSVLLMAFSVQTGLPAASQSISNQCGDARDKLIREYSTNSASFMPTCTDFTQNASSAHFQFHELNSGDYVWAILRESLLKGVESTRAKYGSSLTVTSGYRNPNRQRIVNISTTNSRHIHGDAIDFSSDSNSWELTRQSGKASGACAEPLDLSGWGHVHLDWRGNCPVNW